MYRVMERLKLSLHEAERLSAAQLAEMVAYCLVREQEEARAR